MDGGAGCKGWERRTGWRPGCKGWERRDGRRGGRRANVDTIGPVMHVDPESVMHADPEAVAQAAMTLPDLDEAIAMCAACPRLVAWREEQAQVKVARFRTETYWGRPVPGYGDPDARMLLVGLAPAAHGGNRTGRVFTGDASGDFLWRGMHALGLADRAESCRADDGLALQGVRVAAAVRCAPPANRPTSAEQSTCRPYLVREMQLLPELRVIVALGGVGWDAVLRSLRAMGHATPRPKPRFGHGAEVEIGPYRLIGSYHPSQQNTFTGRLTRPMLEDVLARGAGLAGIRTHIPEPDARVP